MNIIQITSGGKYEKNISFAFNRRFTEFVSIQGHYNLIAREEEREMAPFCSDQNIAITPYSALARGRLSRRPGLLLA